MRPKWAQGREASLGRCDYFAASQSWLGRRIIFSEGRSDAEAKPSRASIDRREGVNGQIAEVVSLRGPAIFTRVSAEGWPSGLRRTLGKRVCGKPYRGFESHSLRQQVIDITETIPLTLQAESGRRADGKPLYERADEISSDVDRGRNKGSP